MLSQTSRVNSDHSQINDHMDPDQLATERRDVTLSSIQHTDLVSHG